MEISSIFWIFMGIPNAVQTQKKNCAKCLCIGKNYMYFAQFFLCIEGAMGIPVKN